MCNLDENGVGSNGENDELRMMNDDPVKFPFAFWRNGSPVSRDELGLVNNVFN